MNLQVTACFAVLGLVFLLQGGEDYNFFMIADTHLGTAESFCTDPKADRKQRTRKDIHRADKAMPHYKALFANIAGSADPKTKFIIEGGDLIEGCARSEAVHKEVIADALNLMKQYFKFPIYMIKGNHEAAGIGGEAAYQAVLLPEIAKYAGVEQLKAANYTIRQDRDFFIFLDYSSPNWYEFLETELKSLKEKPRWLFVVIHPPLLPTSAFRKYALRAVQLLSQYNGILLCGHHHANTVTRYERDGKKVVQMTVTTILQPVPAVRMRMKEKETNIRQFKAEYRKKAELKEKSFVRPFDLHWAPYLTDYRKFSGLGYARIYVSDDDVLLEYHGADLKSCMKVTLMSKK